MGAGLSGYDLRAWSCDWDQCFAMAMAKTGEFEQSKYVLFYSVEKPFRLHYHVVGCSETWNQ
jgi:hypothetical protein